MRVLVAMTLLLGCSAGACQAVTPAALVLGQLYGEQDLVETREAVYLGRPAVPGLLKALQDPDATVRRRAYRALGEIRDRRAARAMRECLKDPDPQVRSKAAWALGEIGDRDAVPALITALDDFPGAAYSAVGALGLR